jgi:hypothetical protein
MTMEHGEDCSVKVAVHARPLIGDEKLQGCKDCVSVVPGKPQVQIGTHSFTFDHVYGSSGTPSAAMFDECVAPLVEGLFQGYNATVLAYGQVNHAYPIHSVSQSVLLLPCALHSYGRAHLDHHVGVGEGGAMRARKASSTSCAAAGTTIPFPFQLFLP